MELWDQMLKRERLGSKELGKRARVEVEPSDVENLDADSSILQGERLALSNKRMKIAE